MWEKDLNRQFSREIIQIASKPLGRCSTSSTIREMEMETTMRYHFTPTRTVKIKMRNWDFSGSPEVKTLCFHCRRHKFDL